MMLENLAVVGPKMKDELKIFKVHTRSTQNSYSWVCGVANRLSKGEG